MPAIFEKEIQVVDEMLDENGHVNNIVFVHWMQDVAIEHATVNGSTSELYRQLNVSWVARSHKIDYLHSALPDDTIIAKTWIAEARKVSCRRSYLFFRKADAEPQPLLARAETEWVFVDGASGRPKKIDDTIAQQFILLGDSPDFENPD